MSLKPHARTRTIVGLVAATLVFAVGGRLVDGHRALEHAWADAGWTLISFIAAQRAYRNAKRAADGPTRRAFGWFAAAFFAWFVGMLIWDVYELFGVYTPEPSWADVGFIALAPLFIVGMMHYGNTRKGASSELKRLSDVGVVLCVMSIVWTVTLYGIVVDSNESALFVLSALTRPVLNFTALVCGLLTWARRPRGDRDPVLTLLIAGMAVFACVTTFYNYTLFTHTYEAGHLLDVFWFIAFALFIGASVEQEARLDRPYDASRPAVGRDALDALVPAWSALMLTLSLVGFGDHVRSETLPALVVMGVCFSACLFLRACEGIRIERRLHASAETERARYRDLVDSAPIGIAAVDGAGRVTAQNPAFGAIMGDAAERALCAELLERVAAVREGASPASLELAVREGAYGRVQIARSQHEGVLLMMEDISEQRAIEQQFIAAQKAEAVGTLAAGMAHDFNNTLMVILASLSAARSALSGRAESAAVLSHLERAEHAIDNARDLTQRLLSLSRKRDAQAVDVNAAEVVGRALDVVRMALPRAIVLEAELASDDAYVHVNSRQLEQAIINLCLNARDAMPNGGKITVSLSHDAAASGDHLRIQVSDEGTGIAAEHRGRIFEPFFTTKGEGAGTGLGLPMVAAFAERHGGEVWAESEPGQGAVFTISLPLVQRERERGRDASTHTSDARDLAGAE